MTLVTRRNTTRSTRNTNAAENPFAHLEGIYINAYFTIEREAENGTIIEERVKLPLGIDVSRLRDREIWANQPQEMKDGSAQLNQMLSRIRKAAEGMEQGQTIDLKLGTELYRRQEPTNETDNKPGIPDSDMDDALFA